MSLPHFSTQGELFSTAGLSGGLFAETDRYRLFAKLVYPPLVRARAKLEKGYCAGNGRVALEPVLMLGVSILQDLDGVPDRQAVELLRYQAGWNFALNRQLGDEVFHPTSSVNFRHRLLEHEQSALGFATILEALIEAGLVSRQSRQRLDSTQMFARVARMSRVDWLFRFTEFTEVGGRLVHIPLGEAERISWLRARTDQPHRILAGALAWDHRRCTENNDRQKSRNFRRSATCYSISFGNGSKMGQEG